MNIDKDILLFLKEVRIFREFPNVVLRDIAKCSRFKNCHKGKIFFLNKNKNIYIIVEGAFKLFKETIEGNEVIEKLLSNNDIFGEKALIGEGLSNYHFKVESTTDSKVFEIPSDCILKHLMDNSELGILVIKEILKQQIEMERLVHYLSVMTADQKVINYFAHILQQSKSDIIELLHNRSCLAVFLGMKPETLSRALKRLQERYIEVQGRKILIKDTHFFREKYLELEVDL